jgi:hypothetical protein
VFVDSSCFASVKQSLPKGQVMVFAVTSNDESQQEAPAFHAPAIPQVHGRKSVTPQGLLFWSINMEIFCFCFFPFVQLQQDRKTQKRTAPEPAPMMPEAKRPRKAPNAFAKASLALRAAINGSKPQNMLHSWPYCSILICTIVMMMMMMMMMILMMMMMMMMKMKPALAVLQATDIDNGDW